jgi:hypothetical protein
MKKYFQGVIISGCIMLMMPMALMAQTQKVDTVYIHDTVYVAIMNKMIPLTVQTYRMHMPHTAGYMTPPRNGMSPMYSSLYMHGAKWYYPNPMPPRPNPEYMDRSRERMNSSKTPPRRP